MHALASLSRIKNTVMPLYIHAYSFASSLPHCSKNIGVLITTRPRVDCAQLRKLENWHIIIDMRFLGQSRAVFKLSEYLHFTPTFWSEIQTRYKKG